MKFLIAPVLALGIGLASLSASAAPMAPDHGRPAVHKVHKSHAKAHRSAKAHKKVARLHHGRHA